MVHWIDEMMTKPAIVFLWAALVAITVRTSNSIGAEASASLPLKPYLLDQCFVSGKSLAEGGIEIVHAGRIIRFCCEDCEGDFVKNPAFFTAKLEIQEKKALDAWTGANQLSAVEFEKLRATKDSVILDVRTNKELESGRIPNSRHLDARSRDIETKLFELDLDKTYLVYDASGERSAVIGRWMELQGFRNVRMLKGGYAAWKKAGSERAK